ncbi:hypothetical protein HGRIS_014243 [Hohenbuehelia grisea]|uniref:Cytochrome P450 n=1 Tax=Hohenbuehelia grisea TaxID=104357 RepID=A0ABR3JTS7_9AGAR
MLAHIFLASFAAYGVFAVWRLFLHPLRSFKGPALAKLTTWYQAYHDIVKHGNLLRQVTALHEIYGPVVRIGPNELSFNDPKAYADIYAMGSKFTKEPSFYQGFGVPHASFGMMDPQASRTRRDMLNPLFSRRAILKLETIVQADVDHLISQLVTNYGSEKPVNLFMAFRCTSLEIITAYCLNQHLHAIDIPDFEHPFLTGLQSTIPLFWVLKYFPALTPIVMEPPTWLPASMLNSFSGISDFRHKIGAHLDNFIAAPEKYRDSEHEIVYDYLLAPANNRKSFKPLSRTELFQEAVALLLAGSDTVGNASTVGFFHVLDNPPVLRKLVAELREAWPSVEDQVGLSVLEKLPYLTAVIKESLRVGHGVVSATPRIVGPGDAVIGGVHVPAGTVVSMSSTYMHLNPDIFENPHQFRPERWLEKRTDSVNLNSYLVPFSRGPRMCLGVNLAWCELYLIFGNLFRKLDLKLHNTTIDDFRDFDAFFVPVHCGNDLHVTIQAKDT